jgi:alpha-tubulin suppressor-like RCC1 family protein
VGTRGEWRLVKCWASGTIGLQTDGSLWFWGQIPYLTRTGARSTNAFAKTMICRETNWVALAWQGRAYARNSAGEWWSLFHDLPDPNTAAATNCLLQTAQSKSEKLVTGIAMRPPYGPSMYEVRSGGTLWTSPMVMMFTRSTTPTENWQRFDGRADWVAVWSDGGTVLGLTNDGILWTWGVDFTAEATGTLKARLDRLETMLLEAFSQPPRRGAFQGMPSLQVKPRPLMKFIPAR